MREGDIETAAVTPQQADLAALTPGDCFASALAKTVGLPPLFRDERFRQTNVAAVVPE